MKLIVTERGASHTPENLEPTETLLDKALELALTDRPAAPRRYERTTRRTITRRGVLWLGQTCNLRCHFCYFLDRIENAEHPEHPFMSLEKAKSICTTLREVYGNTAIDIQGGEPTIWRHILDLVRHCRDIGLYPTLITNALVLENQKKCEQYADAGIRDFLISVQGLGPLHDKVVGLAGAHVRQMKAIRALNEVCIPFRFNCVMSKAATPQLSAIAELAVRTGASAVNFLTFNPFEDQRAAGVRTAENVPLYSEVAGPLERALDILDEGGIEANVRYFPLCMVPERHRKSMYNFKQLPYDHHEWDYASWSWTQQQPQRMKWGDTTHPPVLTPRLRLGSLGRPLRRLAKVRGLGRAMRTAHGILTRLVRSSRPKDYLYANNADLRAKDHCGYQYADACRSCALQPICDGFHGDYAGLFGTGEARPVNGSRRVRDPRHFIGSQTKIVEAEDEAWAL